MSNNSTLSNSSTIDRVNACLAACEGVLEPRAGELAKLRAQRDELVEALEYALTGGDLECEDQEEACDAEGYYWITCLTRGEPAPCRSCKARAAIARAKGGEG